MAATGLQRRKIEVLLDQVEHLPLLPGLAHHLLPLALADRPSRRDLQLAVEVDAGLSSRLVRLAVALGHPAEAIASVDDAFDRLSLDTLAADLLSIEVIDPAVAAQIQPVRLMRHVLATGMAAQLIATRMGTVRPEAALLAGIVHDIGLTALAVLLPAAYSQVLRQIETQGTDLLEAERQILGVDHAILGRRLAQRWGFSTTLQNVVWLHHQDQAPPGNDPEAAALVRVVRLADILVRQEGFTYGPTETVRENPAEAAERLGLSAAHAGQIGRQVAASFELNARPVGLEETPSPEALCLLLQQANVRLGRLYRVGHDCTRLLKAEARRGDLLVQLNAALSGCQDERQVLEALARTAVEAFHLRVAASYLVAPEADYVEGVRLAADVGVEEHFLYPIDPSRELNPPTSGESLSPETAPAPVRAERVEGWLFDRQGPRLGDGPFFTVPMVVEQHKLGGLVFALNDAGRTLTALEINELAAMAGLAGTALKRTRAETALVALTEELAEVGRELQDDQRERLERRNVSALSEMAAGAAHEINNPLAIISGRAQQLAADEEDAARRDTLKTIIQQSARISDIIRELRLFAKPPAPEFQTVDPASIAIEVAAAFSARPETPVLPHVEAADATPAIRVDPSQVAAALTEIVRNAVESCVRSGTRITLAVRPAPAESAVRFIVTDDGPGMDPQVRARAFDPFYSGYEAGRHRGLGLPKAYRAVQANGGQMTLESAPGRGTTVRVTFPAANS